MTSRYLICAFALTLPLSAAAEDEIIVSATRSPRPSAEVGSTVTVVTAIEIERRQYTAVADILRDVAGASIARNSAFGGVASARLRGAASGQTLVVIDGVVVNDPSAPSGGYNFANLDVVDIERIEVLRGPQSILYGADAIGGVISITTKRGRDAAPAAFFEAGSLGLVRGAATIAGGDEARDARITLSGTRTDGISRAAGGAEDDGYRNLGLSFAAGAALAPAWRAEFSGRYAESKAEIDGFPPPAFALADTDETEKTDEYALAGRLLHDGARLSQALTISYADITRENFDGGRFSFGAEGDRLSAEYLARYAFSDAFAATAGVEGERTGVNVSGIEERADNGSVFALFEAAPAPALQLSAGVRRDAFDDLAGATTGRVTGAWQAGANTIVRASWGQGFRAPSLFQVNFNLFGGPPNRDLRPEKSNAYDFGVERRFGDLSARAVFFHQKIDDQIDFDFAGGGYINIAEARARGTEFEAAWSPSAAVTARAHYAFVDAVNRATGARLLRQPRHAGGASIDIRPLERLSLGASLTANGREPDFPAANDRWFRLDFRAALSVSDHLEIYARGENVTDMDYQDVSGYAEPGASIFAGVRVRG